MSCRQAADRKAVATRHKAIARCLLRWRRDAWLSRAFIAEFPIRPLLRRFSKWNFRYILRAERFKKGARRREIEFRISRLDAQEEMIPARQLKARRVEDRMIRLRQTVHQNHAQYGRHRR